MTIGRPTGTLNAAGMKRECSISIRTWIVARCRSRTPRPRRPRVPARGGAASEGQDAPDRARQGAHAAAAGDASRHDDQRRGRPRTRRSARGTGPPGEAGSPPEAPADPAGTGQARPRPATACPGRWRRSPGRSRARRARRRAGSGSASRWPGPSPCPCRSGGRSSRLSRGRRRVGKRHAPAGRRRQDRRAAVGQQVDVGLDPLGGRLAQARGSASGPTGWGSGS